MKNIQVVDGKVMVIEFERQLSSFAIPIIIISKEDFTHLIRAVELRLSRCLKSLTDADKIMEFGPTSTEHICLMLKIGDQVKTFNTLSYKAMETAMDKLKNELYRMSSVNVLGITVSAFEEKFNTDELLQIAKAVASYDAAPEKLKDRCIDMITNRVWHMQTPE